MELPKKFPQFSPEQRCEQHSDQSWKPSSQRGIFKESWKVYYVINASWVTNHKIHMAVSCWLHFLTWPIWYKFQYRKNCKAVNTYHQVFCYPESVNTKWENPMVYCVVFTQCICTEYCESWILSFPSFMYYELLQLPIFLQTNF